MTIASPYPKPDDQPLPPPSRGTANSGWRTNRTLDPIRAAALHEAVHHIAHWGKPDGAWLEEQVITVAERFERWLADTDEAG